MPAGSIGLLSHHAHFHPACFRRLAGAGGLLGLLHHHPLFGDAQLVQRASEIDWRSLDGIRSVGVTAGASAPEVLVNEVIDAFRARFEVTVELVETAQENIEFKVPRILRDAAVVPSGAGSTSPD